MRENFTISPENHLMVHGVDLYYLSKKIGTPIYVFDEDLLIKKLTIFTDAFKSHYQKFITSYSIKTNNNLALCKILIDNGAYAEVATEMDLFVAEKLGIPGKKIIFDGNFKTEEMIRKAISMEVSIINVESFTELKRINDIAGKLDVVQSIGLRINTWKPQSFYNYLRPSSIEELVYCNPTSRFGLSVNDTLEILRTSTNYRNVKICKVRFLTLHFSNGEH